MIAQTLHVFKDGRHFVVACVDGGDIVIGVTPDEEKAAEGHLTGGQLLTVLPLAQAVEIARAILAHQAATAPRFASLDDDVDFDMEWVHDLNYGAGYYRAEL